MPGPDVQQLPGGGGLTSCSFCTCPWYFAWVFLSYLMPSHFIGILSLGPWHFMFHPPLAPDGALKKIRWFGGNPISFGKLQMSVICEVSSSKVSFCLMAKKYVWRGLCRFSCWDSTDINQPTLPLCNHSALDTALVRIRAHQPYTWAGLELAFSAGWEAAKPLAIATDINGPV